MKPKDREAAVDLAMHKLVEIINTSKDHNRIVQAAGSILRYERHLNIEELERLISRALSKAESK